MLCQIPDERLQRDLVETVAHPIERRTQIVHKHLSWVLASDLRGKACSFFDTRLRCLEPEKIGIRRIGYGTSRGGFETCLVVVEPFPSSWCIPVEHDRTLCELGS